MTVAWEQVSFSSLSMNAHACADQSLTRRQPTEPDWVAALLVCQPHKQDTQPSGSVAVYTTFIASYVSCTDTGGGAVGSRSTSMCRTYIKFLTPLKAYSAIISRLVLGKNRNRFVIEDDKGR